jgi:hypothetical protein
MSTSSPTRFHNFLRHTGLIFSACGPKVPREPVYLNAIRIILRCMLAHLPEARTSSSKKLMTLELFVRRTQEQGTEQAPQT